MPIVEVSIPNSVQRTYYHEPNQRFNSIDLNRVSGAWPQDSMLVSILLAMRGLGGVFGASPQYFPLGFKIASYTPSQITVNPGVLISSQGIYYFEGATLTPTPAAYWGLYELEIEDSTDTPVMKDFLDTITQTFSSQLGDSRKVFKLRLYENYNTTASFPTLTPGRLELLNYKKDASMGVLVQSSNVLSNTVPSNGFRTGFLQASVIPADGIEWLTADGSDVPTSFTDLIDVLRSCKSNASTITYSGISDNGSGFCRLAIPANILKNVNLFPYPDDRHTTLELTTSSNSVNFPVGTYRIIGTDPAGLWIDILLAYPSGTSTGDCEIRPFSKADVDGGGARTPTATILQGHLASGNPQDVNRLLFTYQRSKNAYHAHGATSLSVTGSPALTGSVSLSGSATLIEDILQLEEFADPLPSGYNRKMSTLQPGWGGIAQTDSALPSAGTEEGYAIKDGTTSLTSTLAVNAGTLDVGGATDYAEGNISDSDNPNIARPENLTIYYLIKT